jgi:hypothetical protein
VKVVLAFKTLNKDHEPPPAARCNRHNPRQDLPEHAFWCRIGFTPHPLLLFIEGCQRGAPEREALAFASAPCASLSCLSEGIRILSTTRTQKLCEG